MIIIVLEQRTTLACGNPLPVWSSSGWHATVSPCWRWEKPMIWWKLKKSMSSQKDAKNLWARLRFDGLMKMKTATRLSLNVCKASKKVNGTSDYAMAAWASWKRADADISWVGQWHLHLARVHMLLKLDHSKHGRQAICAKLRLVSPLPCLKETPE